jgi:hypothetical protein
MEMIFNSEEIERREAMKVMLTVFSMVSGIDNAVSLIEQGQAEAAKLVLLKARQMAEVVLG